LRLFGRGVPRPYARQKNQNDMRNPTKHIRKNIRLKDFDYSSAGDYFLTLISHQRKNIFGEIDDGKITLNRIGKIIEETWEAIPLHFPYIIIDTYIIMPNHIHGVITMNMVGAWWWDHINPP